MNFKLAIRLTIFIIIISTIVFSQCTCNQIIDPARTVGNNQYVINDMKIATMFVTESIFRGVYSCYLQVESEKEVDAYITVNNFSLEKNGDIILLIEDEAKSNAIKFDKYEKVYNTNVVIFEDVKIRLFKTDELLMSINVSIHYTDGTIKSGNFKIPLKVVFRRFNFI